MAVYLIIAVVLIVFAILLSAPASIDFSFVWNEEIKRTSIKFRYLFIKKNLNGKKPEKNKVEKNKAEKKKKSKYTLDDVRDGVGQAITVFKEIKADIKKLLGYAKNRLVVIRSLDVNADFDTKNPMNTGILTGGINGGAYTAMSFIDRNMNLKKWSIRITPLFENRDYFDVSIEGIIEIKTAHIIVILLKSVPMLLKVRKLFKIYNKDERK